MTDSLTKRLVGPASLAVLAVVSCGDDGTPGASCDVGRMKLVECKLIDNGVLTCPARPTLVDACAFACVARASCAALETTYCGDGPPSSLESCLFGCLDRRRNFRCDDGQSVSDAFLCDGDEDCADGSDERDCGGPTSFTCDNGQSVPADYRCDLEEDCTDGSDEPAECARVQCATAS